jgi:hypothetical protein
MTFNHPDVTRDARQFANPLTATPRTVKMMTVRSTTDIGAR